MSNAPITVSGRALPEAVTKNIIKGPTVKPVIESSLISNNILGGSLGFNQSVYKVKLVANGRTFNMLLPPSIESKHPGRSNPLQLPGLQIESTSNISKLKIPGFFPIYQHLGVESLYISMSGMFTGYDGEDQISSAGDWEGWANPEVKGGQDAYTAACDLFDFAVKNKALTTVTISTSDGSFEPKKSPSNNFRDEQSNIRFKGYIKELKQIYIRQDRVYYMLKFEIIDLGNSKKECIKNNKSLLGSSFNSALGIGRKDLFNTIPNAAVGEGTSISNTDKILQDIIFSKLPNTDVTKIIEDIVLNRLPNTTFNKFIEDLALNRLPNTVLDKILEDIILTALPKQTQDISKLTLGNLSLLNIQKALSNQVNEILKNQLITSNLELGTLSLLNNQKTLTEEIDNLLNKFVKNNVISPTIFNQLINIKEASKNDIKLLDSLKKSLQNVNNKTLQLLDNDLKTKLVSDKINQTIKDSVNISSINQALFAIKESPLINLDKKTEINKLINLRDLNSIEFDKSDILLEEKPKSNNETGNPVFEAARNIFKRDLPSIPITDPNFNSGIKPLNARSASAQQSFEPFKIERQTTQASLRLNKDLNQQLTFLNNNNNIKEENNIIPTLINNKGVISKEELRKFNVVVSDINNSSSYKYMSNNISFDKNNSEVLTGIFKNDKGDLLFLKQQKNSDKLELINTSTLVK